MAVIGPVMERDVFNSHEIDDLLQRGAAAVIIRETLPEDVTNHLAQFTAGERAKLGLVWGSCAHDSQVLDLSPNPHLYKPDQTYPTKLGGAFGQFAVKDLERMKMLSLDTRPVKVRFHDGFKMVTGAHVDLFANIRFSHRHCIGKGMWFFCPQETMEITPANGSDSFCRTVLDGIVSSGNATYRQMKEGEVAFFNEKSLHYTDVPEKTADYYAPKFRYVIA